MQSPVPDGTCKTQESANTATRQRNTHSTGDSQAFRPFKPTLHPSVAAKTSIKVEKPLWVPSAGCKGYWSKTNAALAAVIEQTCPGLSSKPPHLALQSLTKIVHSFFAEEETSSSPPEMKKRTRNRGSHTPTSMRNLRKKLRELRREWRQRCNEPSDDTAGLRHEFHQTHKRIKRLARQQKSSEKNERLMKEAFKFRSNPYKYGRKVFNSKSTENPSFSAEEAEAFFPERFADTDRSYCYSPFSELPPAPSPEFNISSAPPSFDDYKKVLLSRRNSSAPGPNGIPNTVWKRCQCLHQPLYSIIRRVWSSTNIPASWQCATIRLFHKSGSTNDPSNFRPIALSNCEGKVFFSLVSKAVLRHMLRNSFFDKRLQKGFLPDVAGCLEHSSLLSDALRDARAHQRSICISWLDLKNAFGSVRHSLIIFALQYYGFPDHFIQLVRSYYDHLSVIVAVPGILSTNAIHFALGVFQGCTLSPTLFNIIVQLALDSVEQKQCGYDFSSDPETVLQSSAYADDVQFVTSLVEQNQCLLNIFDSFLLWSQTMSARPNKCWSVALRKHASGSYHRFDPRLTISNEALQYLDDGDFRYLGRPTNVKRSESRCRAEVEAQLSQWLDTINDLDLPATSKLWLYQHFVVSKLAWPFTSLDFSLTFVQQLEAVATRFLKQWSGLPRPANTAILHLGSSNRAGLHIKQLSTFWKQMQAVRMDILKSSSDPRCSRLYDRLLANQSQWSRQFPPAVEHACAATVVEANSSELTTQTTSLEPASRRKRILNIIAEIDTESQLSRLRQLAVQGRWLEWTDAMHSDLSWRRLIHGLDDGELRFNLRAISNTLPTPDNLRRWGQNEVDPACPLCGRPATLRHILNSCSVALHQGRYTWRHDSVLEVLQRHLTSFWKHVKSEPLQDQAPFIRLVKEGAPRLPCQRRHVRPLLSDDVLRCARDWQFLFDVGTGYSIFPLEIAATRQRPDVVIFSQSLRVVILIELTVPLEDRIAAANTRKTDRYSALLATCENNGWHATHFPVEVGSRGWVAHSLLACLQKLGFSASWRKKVRRECSRVALRCSYLLYLRRSIKTWNSFNELSPDLSAASENRDTS